MDTDILAQDRFLSYGSLPVAPLHGAGREKLEDYGKELRSWLSAFESVCFLDVTFFDVLQNRTPFSVMIGPLRYWDVLSALVETREFLLGNHAVFMNGLPVVDGVVPDNREELLRLEAYGRLKNANSAFFCRQNGPAASQSLGSAEWEVLTIDPTDYDKAGLTEATEKLYPIASLRAMWRKYYDALFDPSHGFISKDGRRLRTLVAMPVGVRRIDDPSGYFINLANLYLGTADSWDASATTDLLLNLQVHIFRSNAYQLGTHEGKGLGADLAASTFGHEVKKVTRLLTGDWMPSCDRLFARHPIPPSAGLSERQIGWLTLGPDFEDLDLGIVPFRDELLAAGQLMNLWCGNASEADAPIEGRPDDISGLIAECWRVSVRAIAVYALTGKPADSATTILERREELSRLMGLFLAVEISVDGRSPQIDWGAARERTFWLARLLICALNNVAKHGDPSWPPRVTVRRERDSTIIAITNRRRGQDREGELDRLAIRLNEDRATVENRLRTLENGIAKMAHAFGGRNMEILKHCAKRLDGEVEEKPGDPFEVICSFLSRGAES